MNTTWARLLWVGVLVLAAGAPARANLIDKGTSTIDTSAGLEWLDVSLTEGVSYDNVVAGFGGYVSEGYVHATADQICGLFAALGDSVTGCGAAGSASGILPDDHAQTLVNLLGITFFSGATKQQASAGIYQDAFSPDTVAYASVVNDFHFGCTLPTSHCSNWETNTDYIGPDEIPAFAGNWLVRVAVPEPATLSIFGFGLLGLGFCRRKH